MISLPASKINTSKTVNYGKLYLLIDGTLIFEPFSTLKNVETNKLMDDVAEFVKIADGKKISFLYDATGLNDFSAEQKKYLQNSLPSFASRMVILTGNGLSVFFTNFFMMLYKPNIPIKAFKKIDTALEWLNN